MLTGWPKISVYLYQMDFKWPKMAQNKIDGLLENTGTNASWAYALFDWGRLWRRGT